MNRAAVIPVVSGFLAAETIDVNTPLSLGVFASGLVFTGCLLWRESKRRQQTEDRLAILEKLDARLAVLEKINARLASLDSIEARLCGLEKTTYLMHGGTKREDD